MIDKLLLEHPRAVGETYLEHQQVALSYAWPLFVAACAALVHAVVPGLCVKTSSRTIKALHARLHQGHGRGAAADAEYAI